MKSNYEIACEVLEGKWGNGQDRIDRLWNAGYDPSAVQAIVNCLVNDRAREPEQGKYLEVDVDLSVYDGIQLNFKKG